MEYICNHPGISAQEMMECIRVDKATLTKVIKKLNEIGYIEIARSEDDKRVSRLYLTKKALPAARRIKEIHGSFYDAMCAGISSLDIQKTEQTLTQMMENINQKVWHRMEAPYGE